MHSKAFASAVENTLLCFLCSLSLQPSLMPFSFPLIFHDDKKDEKKIIGNACSCVTLPLNIAFCQGKHKKWTIFSLIKLLFDINVVK